MRSKIEANEYKDYILGFIFYKFLSETEIARLRAEDWGAEDLKGLDENDAETVQYVRDLCGYFISYNNLFSTWIASQGDFTIADVRDALSAFERNIDPARKRVFVGIFDTLQTGLSKLGTDEKSRSKAVRDLIYLIKDIPMDSRQDYDTLGFIYEYLISNFASNAGKKAGEFYTPSEVSQLMSEIVAWHLAGREEINIYDPTSGSGSLLIHIGQAVARRNGNPNDIKYYAQELKENTYNLTRMNLVMRGILPDNIVARNGDTLKSDTQSWKVTGFIALPDYSCLFQNNNDSMFDSVKFGIGVVTSEAFESLDSPLVKYCYAWKYNDEPTTEKEEKEVSDALMKAINKDVSLEEFVPRYLNQAIIFTRDDMGSDRAMMIVFLYIVIAIMAFVFGITISNTIAKEANVIGTLLASGYTRNELIRHYMAMPILVTLVGALIGNVLGYTIMKDICVGMYYGSYSLPTYVTVWNAEAFLLTTIIPILLMLTRQLHRTSQKIITLLL